MDEQFELQAKRREAREEIFRINVNTSLERIFRLLGKLIPRSLSQKNAIYWLFQIFLLNGLILLPGLLLSIPLRDFENIRALWGPTVVTTECIVLGFIVARISQQILFKSISNQIVEKITDVESLARLINWLQESWSIKTIAPYVLIPWLAYDILTLVTGSNVLDGFIGLSSALMVLAAGFCFGILFHYMVWITLLNFQLRDYQYNLNVLSPANSEVVSNISGISNRQIYLLAIYFAIFTFVTSRGLFGEEITRTIAFPVVIMAWALVTLQFVITRSTTNNIIEKAKWKTLNKLQAQINQLEATGDLSDKDTSEKLLRLNEIYNRITVSPAGAFDLKSVSTFLNQLMLPLLGFLIGNLNDILAFRL